LGRDEKKKSLDVRALRFDANESSWGKKKRVRGTDSPVGYVILQRGRSKRGGQ